MWKGKLMCHMLIRVWFLNLDDSKREETLMFEFERRGFLWRTNWIRNFKGCPCQNLHTKVVSLLLVMFLTYIWRDNDCCRKGLIKPDCWHNTVLHIMSCIPVLYFCCSVVYYTALTHLSQIQIWISV
jgi:hypothetical protein